MDILFLVGRVMFGGFFLINAWNNFSKLEWFSGYAASKGVPWSKTAVFLSGVLLLLGGLGVLLGAYPRVALILLIAFLLPVTFTMHAFWRAADPQEKMSEMIQFMKNTALIGAALMLLAVPEPWALSVL